jgi:hypothetical protein
MSEENPVWLLQAREYCRSSGIEIVGWGPDLLTVEAKSDERAKEITSQLGQLGFKAIENEDDAYAGLLNLSKNPAAIQAKIASFDISRRRWDEQIVPLIWALGSRLLFPGLLGDAGRSHSCPGQRSTGNLVPELVRLGRHAKLGMAAGNGSAGASSAAELSMERATSWEEIEAVETAPAGGRNQEAVMLKLKTRASERLGSFNCAFARNLRDRLRIEIARRRGEAV